MSTTEPVSLGASTTSWRDGPLIPADYEDLSALVKLARRARGQIVEFDWAFSRDDLERLRRAIYEWGSPVRGVYRCFDARALAAVNRALGEADTVLTLNEPKDAAYPDCVASCIPNGDEFRLQGSASFDIMLGWGAVGVEQSGPGRQFLTPAIRETLATSVGMLGWDLRRLQEARFAPVWNALFGLPLSYGLGEVTPSSEPELQVSLAFQGPFSGTDEGDLPCLFADPIAEQTGIYIWTIEVDGGERPWYVGQTRRTFGRRMGEHLSKMLAGEYVPHDPEALLRGDSSKLCPGVDTCGWPLVIPELLRRWEELAPQIASVIRHLRFHIASLDGDGHLFDRVEGALARYYKTHPLLELSSFIAPGLRVPAAVPGDQRMRLTLSSTGPIAGLPLEIVEPAVPLPEDVHRFVEATPWTFAKTYAETWPHEYVVKTAENAEMIVALARHIERYGVAARFYSEVRRYHREGGKVYWTMSAPEAATLVNRCDEAETYEARLAAGTLPQATERRV